MTESEFRNLIEMRKKKLHNENIEDLIRLGMTPLDCSDDPEYGEFARGETYLPSIIYPQRNGKYPVPRVIPDVNRGDYQKQMALYYDDKKNFATLLPLDSTKYYLDSSETQNHFTAEMLFYLNVLYNEVHRKVQDKASNNRLIIGSGFRSIAYNKTVDGSSEWSAHSSGMAVDIHSTHKEDRILILDAAYRIGFGGLGLYDTWIHIDLSGRCMWGGYTGLRGGK